MKKKIKRYLTEKRLVTLIIILSLIVIILPQALRYVSHKPILAGQEGYYHTHVAEQIKDKGVFKYDEFITGGRAYIPNLYHIILAGLSFLMPVIVAAQLFSMLLGVISLLLFNSLLKRFKARIEIRFLAVLILILSPIFINSFTIPKINALAVVLVLLGFYLFSIDKKLSFIASIVVCSLIPFLGIYHAFIMLIILGAYSMFKKTQKRFLIICFILFTITTLYYAPAYLSLGIPEKAEFVGRNLVKESLADLGGMIGFGVFTIMLAVAGLIYTWRNKKKFAYFYLALAILLISMMYSAQANPYLNLVFSVMAAIGLARLMGMKWDLKLIRDLSVLVIAYGLLFSAVSYTITITNLEPGKSMTDSLYWLKSNSGEGEVVFSHYSRGFWIENMAERPVLMDSLFYPSQKINEKYNDSTVLFESRELKKAKAVLDKHSIDYIFIDKEMKQGLVWEQEEEGLLFLFRNNETFNNIYNHTGIEIWKIKR